MIGVCMPDGPDLVAALLGVWRLGGVVADLNPALPPAERDALAKRAGVETLLTEVSFEHGSLAGAPRLAGPRGEPDPRVACINLTSGSTGVPKGVVLTHENLVRNAELYGDHFGLTTEDRTCLVLPVFFGMNKIALLAHLLAGATVVLAPSAGVPNKTLAAMQAHRATGLVSVPTAIRTLLRRGDLARYRVPSLRYVRVGAGRVDVTLMAGLRSAFPAAEVFLTYGLTEVGLVTVMTASEFDARPGSCGRPIPEVEVRCTAGGEIVVRCPHLALGYWRDEAETAAVFRQDGLHTGDLGRLDDDGYLYLTGREKELIKSGGENVHPAVVEAALLSHPRVAECAVVGAPDEWLGEVVVAYVVPSQPGELDEEELRRHSVSRLRPVERPTRFVFAATLPRTETGKVRRSELEG
jgi:acyl-CoA synthetase (AMP-forming)/AMP-acid ligase II